MYFICWVRTLSLLDCSSSSAGSRRAVIGAETCPQDVQSRFYVTAVSSWRSTAGSWHLTASSAVTLVPDIVAVVSGASRVPDVRRHSFLTMMLFASSWTSPAGSNVRWFQTSSRTLPSSSDVPDVPEHFWLISGSRSSTQRPRSLPPTVQAVPCIAVPERPRHRSETVPDRPHRQFLSTLNVLIGDVVLF